MYTIADIARITGCNRETVRRWIRSGRLKAEGYTGKKGDIIRISEEEWLKFKYEKYWKEYWKIRFELVELGHKEKIYREQLKKVYSIDEFVTKEKKVSK